LRKLLKSNSKVNNFQNLLNQNQLIFIVQAKKKDLKRIFLLTEIINKKLTLIQDPRVKSIQLIPAILIMEFNPKKNDPQIKVKMKIHIKNHFKTYNRKYYLKNHIKHNKRVKK